MNNAMNAIKVLSKWQQLFAVHFEHDFYKNKIEKQLQFYPTIQTQQLLKAYNIIFKISSYGFVLLCQKNQSKTVLNTLSNKKFTFKIACTNTYFQNITDIPFIINDSILYFSNLSVPISQYEMLVSKPSIFKYTRKVDLEYEILDYRNVSIFKGGDEQINLQEYSDGKYCIQSDGTKNCFYKTQKDLSRYLGILDIYINAKVPNSNRFLFKDKIKQKKYSIQFKARNTFWKFFIIDRANSTTGIELANIKLEYQNNTIPVDTIGIVSLPNGMKAFAFNTQDSYPLQEKWSEKDKLFLRISQSNFRIDQTILINKPNFKTIQTDKKTSKIYTVSYIYI